MHHSPCLALPRSFGFILARTPATAKVVADVVPDLPELHFLHQTTRLAPRVT